MEIEKKYLLKTLPTNLSDFKKINIRQGYISTDPVIRIRQSNEDFILTVKGPGSMEREEYELPLTNKQFDRLLEKVVDNQIIKSRYLIPLDKDYIAELDIYENQLEGLTTVEVEFPSITDAEKFIPPEWFGEDITYNHKYKNSSLSKVTLESHFGLKYN